MISHQVNKIIFFGTSTFSSRVLKYLIESKVHISAIVTQPDKPIKRSKAPVPPPVKAFAIESCPNILIFQPNKASDRGFIEKIRNLDPDLFIVVAYGQILKKSLLEIPKLGPINIHASLLPKYRGAAPIQRVIMDGEQRTGITIMKMNEKMDAGEIILKKECSIELEDTFLDVEEKLIGISCELITQVLDDYRQGKCFSSEQNHSMATFAPKIDPEECQINWNSEAFDVHNKIRALSPKPGAWSFVKIDEKFLKIKIISSKIINTNGAPGSVIQKDPLVVSCENQGILIQKVQPEGRKIMDAKSWVNGINKKTFTFT